MSNTRVLCRQLARDLSQKEVEAIAGGFFTSPHNDFTTTFCTIHDGDDD